MGRISPACAEGERVCAVLRRGPASVIAQCKELSAADELPTHRAPSLPDLHSMTPDQRRRGATRAVSETAAADARVVRRNLLANICIRSQD